MTRALTLAAGVAALALLLGTYDAAAEPACGLYEYRAKITGVHDGDTVTADVDLGFHTWIHDEKFRLLGIDAPEVTGAYKARGIVSRDALAGRVLDKELTICTVEGTKGNDKREKFGRYLVKIYIGDELVNDWMIVSGFAVEFMP